MEMEKHRMWRKKTSLIETPTILVNGYKLPNEYELVDLAMIDNLVITEKYLVRYQWPKHYAIGSRIANCRIVSVIV